MSLPTRMLNARSVSNAEPLFIQTERSPGAIRSILCWDRMQKAGDVAARIGPQRIPKKH